MQKRFQSLLNRYGIARTALDDARRTPNAEAIKLLRLSRLELLISQKIKEVVRQSAIRRASRPRFTPTFAARPSRPTNVPYHA